MNKIIYKANQMKAWTQHPRPQSASNAEVFHDRSGFRNCRRGGWRESGVGASSEVHGQSPFLGGLGV